MKTAISYNSFMGVVVAGFMIMLFADFLFALNDAMGKWLMASFALGQVLVMRSVGFIFILAPMIIRQGPSAFLTVSKPHLVVLRAAMATLDTALFYAAVAYLPLADVMTFFMAAPVYVAALSHFFLGERLGWRRWLARCATGR